MRHCARIYASEMCPQACQGILEPPAPAANMRLAVLEAVVDVSLH
jgi:hypothetical protein